MPSRNWCDTCKDPDCEGCPDDIAGSNGRPPIEGRNPGEVFHNLANHPPVTTRNSVERERCAALTAEVEKWKGLAVKARSHCLVAQVGKEDDCEGCPCYPSCIEVEEGGQG